MKIAIVEDDESNRQTLHRHISDYAQEYRLSLTVDSYPDGIDFIKSAVANYDIIYLDIEMTTLDGLKTAKQIRQTNERVIIVFITNFIDYAIEGYQVDASDFLLKPLTYFNFSKHFNKLNKLINQRHNQCISVKRNGGIQKLSLKDIYYIESQGHYLHFHMKDETVSIIHSIKKIESKLLPAHFFRCNNYYLINLSHVEKLEDNHVIVKGQRLQFSRPRKKAFINALTSYIGGTM